MDCGALVGTETESHVPFDQSRDCTVTYHLTQEFRTTEPAGQMNSVGAKRAARGFGYSKNQVIRNTLVDAWMLTGGGWVWMLLTGVEEG